MCLPWFGGSASVWNTCLVFFQGLLLVGYAYGHFAPRWLGTRRTCCFTACCCCCRCWSCQPIIGASAAPLPGSWPVPSLLRALALSVALPFFVLSTNSTLVQRWFSATAAAASPIFSMAPQRRFRSLPCSPTRS